MGMSFAVPTLSGHLLTTQRIPYIIQLPAAIYVLIAVQFVPETPRFLMGKGRYEEAFQFLVEYHGNGDREDKLVLFEYEEMKEANTKEREAKAEKWETILRSPNNRHRLGLATLMIFMVSLSGSSIIYWYYTIIYSQVGITDPTTQTGIQAGLNVLTWFSQIAAVYLGRKVGRKTILLWVWPMLLGCLVGLCASRYVPLQVSF
jgi:SP family sugar:H+ symporter-like MFS transporter